MGILEQHPLGRAEWIKLLGILLGKIRKKLTQFSEQVEARDYLEAVALLNRFRSRKTYCLEWRM